MPYWSDEDLARQRRLEEGWEHELSRQKKEKEGNEPSIEISIPDPQNEDNCAPNGAKILFLLFVVSSQLYQLIT